MALSLVGVVPPAARAHPQVPLGSSFATKISVPPEEVRLATLKLAVPLNCPAT